MAVERLDYGDFSLNLYNEDVRALYARWPSPTVIISDGAYGVGGFPGDPKSPRQLRDWYAPHAAAWAERASPFTTLWFWGTELSWATVHPLLEEHGWAYKACHIWNKGIGHVAGNVNTQTLTHLPIVTEVCVQYARKPVFFLRNQEQSLQDWLRAEWARAGLPFSLANQVCGVKNAATRKYLTSDHNWYPPPAEAFMKLHAYANQHGEPAGRPYFDLEALAEGALSLENAWDRLRAKFHCPIGVTNVWDEPSLRGKERIKIGGKALHTNQKPIRLLARLIEMSSDPGDVIWDVFGGVYSGAVAALQLGRTYYGAEIQAEMHAAGLARLAGLRPDAEPR